MILIQRMHIAYWKLHKDYPERHSAYFPWVARHGHRLPVPISVDQQRVLRDITHSTKSLACVTSLLLIQQLECLSIVWQNNPYHFRSSIMSNSVFNSSPCLVAPLPPPSRNNQSFCGRGLGNNLRSAQLRAMVLSAHGITACAISSRDVNEPPTASHIFLLYSSI